MMGRLGSTVVKILTVMAATAALSSCVLFKHEPTLTKPAMRDLAGTYVVEEVSWRARNKKALKAATIHLSADGLYRVSGVAQAAGGMLLPPANSGTWEVYAVWGLDLGSRQNWGVLFSEPTGKVNWSCHCQGEPKPWGLLFTDYTVHKQLGDHLLLRRSGP